MRSTERIGLAIVAVVYVFVVAVYLITQIRPTQALGDAPNFDWTQAGRDLIFLVVGILGFWYLGIAFWKGQEIARWVTLTALIVMGLGLVGLAVWVTTLDYPNAVTPEARAEMQADDRRQLPWRIGRGVVPIVVGGLLMLPPVGHFLGYRRRARAEPAGVANGGA